MAVAFSFFPAFAETEMLSVDFGKLYEITYEAKDVTIFDVTPNPDEIELIFEIDVTSPIATLELTIPRDLLDSTEDDNDVDFFVIADGDLVTFSEKEATSSTRTLFIQLSPGTTELEVFGTHLAGSEFESVPQEDNVKETPLEEIPEDEIGETDEQIDEEASTPTKEDLEEQAQELEEMMAETEMEEEQTEDLMEKPTIEKETQQSIFDFPNIQDWYVDVSKRQMKEFAVATAMFVALVIILAAIKGARTAQNLP